MRKRFPSALLHTLPLAALFALACALLAPAAPSTARRARRAQREQEESKKSQPPSNTTVYGRAVYDDTNRPVRRARVMLVDEAGSRPEYNALTDSDGAFRIEHVREGSYIVFVDAPGVISPVGFMNFSMLRGRGAPDFTEARKFLDVVDVDGKQDSRVTVHARRGAALGGKVTYADGDPAVNVTVNVMRRGAGGHLEKLLTGINITAISGLRTDDRGIFRVSGLPPGEYVVGVSEQVEHGESGGEGMGSRDPTMSVLEGLSRQQFLMTFYPSAVSAKEATVIKADAGVERSDIDITIPARELHLVGGVVRGKSDKRPVKGAKVTIVRRDENAGGEPPEITPPKATRDTRATNGRRRALGVQGDSRRALHYHRQAVGRVRAGAFDGHRHPDMNANTSYGGNMNSGYRRPRPKKGYAPGRRDLQVIDSDLTDLAVELNDGGRVSGSVTLEGAKPVGGGSGSVSLRRVPDGADVKGSGLGRELDGVRRRRAFRGKRPPRGQVLHGVPLLREEGRLYVKSMTWNGKDLTARAARNRRGRVGRGRTRSHVE
jgi:hypothetical protein